MICPKCGGPTATPDQWERGACGNSPDGGCECDACVLVCWGGVQCADEGHRAMVKHGSAEAIQRAKFESWVAAPPFECPVSRQGDNAPWPGQYDRIEVQLAWEAWQEARK